MEIVTSLAVSLEEHLYVAWTFLLLMVRYSALFVFLPGIGESALLTKFLTPGLAFTMSVASLIGGGPFVDVPENWFVMLGAISSEFFLGLSLGFIPAMIVSGVRTAGGLAATSMGLGAAQLIDPTLGVSVTTIARITGDLVIVLFLLIGGHYVLIHAAAGFGGQLVPGSFLMGMRSTELFINRSADIFRVGVMISAPVIVALLLTQFVMGMITKAVPTVNIFIVSFPLTIGIGLTLSALSVPEIVAFCQREIVAIENSVRVLMSETTLRQPPPGF